MLRAIREIKPTWIVGENVPGLINWNGGMVFEEVQSDLEADGYEVIPFILPAASVNAPHRRERVWFVAHSGLFGQEKRQKSAMGTNELCEKRAASNAQRKGLQKPEQGEQHEQLFNVERNDSQNDASDTSSEGVQGRPISGGARSIRTESNQQPARFFRTDWEIFPTVSPIHERNDGISDRLSGITFSKWRNESVKACGNAIVPQVVYQIFKAINNYEQGY